MNLYTRHQLAILLALVAAAGAGLGVERWRRAHSDVAEGLELLDRTPLPPVAPRRAAVPKSRARPHAALLDVNRVAVEDLQTLPGVGRALATRIVQARPFDSVDDLARVRGLRGARLERLRPLITVAP